MDKKKLTDKQEMFCLEYMVDLNATQAAIRAGYSEKTAQQISNNLLLNVVIQERIQQLKERRSAKVEVTAERVIKEIATLAFSNIPNYFNQIGPGSVLTLTLKQFEDMPEDASRAISSVEQSINKEGEITYKVKLWDKTRNLEMLCRHLGIAEDSIKVDINAGLEKEKAKHLIEELINQVLLK